MDHGAAGGQSSRQPPRAASVTPPTDSWSQATTPHEGQSPLRAVFTRTPATLRLSGIIDESTYHVLTRALKRAAVGADPDLCIDVTRVELFGFAGLRALTTLPAAAGTTLRHVILTGLPAQPAAIANVLGWDITPGLIIVRRTGPNPK